MLYGKSTSKLTSSKDLSKGESYEPDNLEYIEWICDGFNRNKYILRKINEKNHQNFYNHISDVFKVFWSRIQDEYSENDFVIKYPYFPNDSINSKGTYSKLIEVKSTRRFYEYLLGQKEEMFATYIQRKSLRSVVELYEMKKDKVHEIIQSLNINFEPQIITNEKLTLFINLDVFWIRNNHQSYKEIQKYAYNGILSKMIKEKYIQ